MKIEDEMGVKIIFPSSRNEDHISKMFFFEFYNLVSMPLSFFFCFSLQSLKVVQWTV